MIALEPNNELDVPIELGDIHCTSYVQEYWLKTQVKVNTVVTVLIYYHRTWKNLIELLQLR